MAVVRVRGPLRKLAGGRAEHELEGATVVEVSTSAPVRDGRSTSVNSSRDGHAF